MLQKKYFFVIAFTIALTSCKKDKTKTMNVPGIDLTQIDITVEPKDDIYNFVNGTWMRETEIPKDQTRWGSFTILRPL